MELQRILEVLQERFKESYRCFNGPQERFNGSFVLLLEVSGTFQGVLRGSAGFQGHFRGSQRRLIEVSGDKKRTQGCVRLPGDD